MKEPPFLDVSPMTDREWTLLRLVWEHGAVTVQTAAQMLGLSPHEVGQVAERITRAGFIRQSSTAKVKVRVYSITDLGKVVASKKPTVYLMRHGRRQMLVPVMHLAGMRLQGKTVCEVADEVGYVEERTVQRHLQALGMTGRRGRPRKVVGE